MNPTNEDFQPRRDGWFEHRGVWEEVTIGTVIGSQKRTERWRVIDQAHGKQVEPGYTLWTRVREETSGEEKTIRPRPKRDQVKILTQDPADTQTPDPTPPSDSDAIELLVRELGATHLASRDNATGEITCPNYASGRSHSSERALHLAELEHLRFAHGIDTAELEALEDDAQVIQVGIVHGRAHNSKHPEVGKGGFPHRHIPEDLSIM